MLWGELKAYTDEAKAELADDFADKYEGKIDAFIEFISQKKLAAPRRFQADMEVYRKGQALSGTIQ